MSHLLVVLGVVGVLAGVGVEVVVVEDGAEVGEEVASRKESSEEEEDGMTCCRVLFI